MPRYKRKSAKYGRTIALIDAANIIYANKHLHWSIDHEKFIQYLRSRYAVKKVVYYAGLEKGDTTREAFYKKIQRFGFDVKLKDVVTYRGKYYWKRFTCSNCKRRIKKRFQGPPIKKSNCDVDLTVDSIRLSPSFDTLFLFSGDGDFSSLVEYLKKKKKKTVVFSSLRNCARKLRKAAHAFVEIDQLRNILEFAGQ